MNLDPRLVRQLGSVRAFFALTIWLGLGGGVLIIAQAAVLTTIIARVFLRGATLAETWTALLGLLAIIGARAVCAWGSEASAAQIAARIKRDLRERILTRLFDLGPAYARGERTGELTHTVSEGIEALDAYFSQYLPQLVLAALVPLAVLAFVFPLDWLSGIVLLATGPLIPLFMILIGNAVDALTRQQYRELSLLSAHFLDVLQGLTTLKIFGRSREQIETIARVSERYRDTTLGVLRVAFLSALALEMIATISTAIVAVQVGLRLLAGHMPFEQAFFVLVLAPDFYLPLRLLGTRFHAGMSGVAAAARIFEILETTAGAHAAPNDLPASAPIGQRAFVVFDTVSCAYAGDQPALNGVSFEIARGQRVALVGATGAGKSTVANLLLRFIEPTRGEMTCAGISWRDCSPRAWRAQIAWVPQMPYLFNASVAANLRLARPSASQDELIRAAQLAHADEFIRALPHGYETIIGERGARLSGGQAQRIAMARAFLKDAPLLILDEATSQLDVENEARIQDTIEHLMRERTVLSITHRLATAARADTILVLDQGRIVETGTHDALLQQRGAYYRLVTAGQPNADRDDALIEKPRTAEQPQNILFPIEEQKSEIENRISFSDSRHTLLRLLAFVAPYKGFVALAVLLGALTIGSGIGLMAASAYIIARAALHPSIADLAVPIVGVRFFGIARGVFRYLERYVSHYVNFSVLAELRVWLYTALEPRAPANLFAHRTGDLLARIIGDIETLQNFFVRVLAPPLVAISVAIGMSAFLFVFSPALALGVLGVMFLAGVIVPMIVRLMSRAANQRLIAVRAELNAQLVDSIQGIAEVIAFGREADHRARGQTLNRKWTRAQIEMAMLASAHNALGNWLAHMALWSALVIAIPHVTAAQLDGVYLPVIALAVLASFEGVLALPLAFQYLESNRLAARRLFEIAEAPENPRGQTQTNTPEKTSSRVSTLGRGVSLSVTELSFRYAPDAPLALDHISFDLPAGKTLALVGVSGAGKSTLVNLLLRFWDSETGAIQIGGRDLREIAPDAAREFFAVVAQPTHLFNATIRENLLLARPSATDAELVRAAQLAQIHDFIAELPDGYATRIGEQGLRLSGGERQRLALARALIKEAPILVLDEATANLDPLTERNILRALYAERRTTLVITHRLIELESVEEILVLRAGRIIERGRHAELMQPNRVYRQMWERQQIYNLTRTFS